MRLWLEEDVRSRGFFKMGNTSMSVCAHGKDPVWKRGQRAIGVKFLSRQEEVGHFVWGGRTVR